jgi:type I restriction enzyme, S subunit
MSIEENWETWSLPDVLEFREGPGILARDFRNEGIPLIRLAGLKQGSAILSGCNYLDPEMVELRWRQFRVRTGDVLLSTSASLGEVAVVDDVAQGAIPYTGIILFRPKDDRVHAGFIQYALRAPSFKRQIEAMGVGSVMRHFGPSHLKSMTLDLPSNTQQLAIVDVLGALDDKIAVNDRVVGVSHQLAQVHTVAALSGVERTPLGELAEVTMGSSPPGDTYNEVGVGLSFYQGTRDFGFRFPSQRVWCDKPVRVAPEGATLVSVRAPVGRLNVATEKCCIGRGLAALVSKFGTPSVLFHSLSAITDVWAPFEAEGTVFGSINKKQLEGLAVPLADPTTARALEEVLAALDARVEQLFVETASLRDLRDALLPALMSGRMRVREAEGIAEAVT